MPMQANFNQTAALFKSGIRTTEIIVTLTPSMSHLEYPIWQQFIIIADIILKASNILFINININIIKIYVITGIDFSDIISPNSRFGYLCFGLGFLAFYETLNRIQRRKRAIID